MPDLESHSRVREVAVTGTELTVYLTDGSIVSVPLNWFPRLLNATPEQRSNFSATAKASIGPIWTKI